MFSAARGRAAWKEGWNDMGCQLGLMRYCSTTVQRLGLCLLSP
jgi:hypothetical protein